MQQSPDVPERGLRKNAVGLGGLVAQSLGVTAPEISAVVIASVVASKVAGATPFAFIVAAIGALGLALIYGRFARRVPHAGGTYAIVRAGLGRDVGFFAGWVLLAVGIVFVPALLIAAAFLLQNFFSLVLPHATFLSSNWVFWAALLGVVVIVLSYLGIQLSARILLTLTAIGVTMLVVFDILILANVGASGFAWKSLTPNGNSLGELALAVGIAMTGFSGFEAAVFLAEEARTPRRQVPKAVVGAMLLAAAFFIFTTFSIVTGYGMDDVGKHWPLDSGASVVILSAQYISLTFGKILLLLLAVSALAAALGTANFATLNTFIVGPRRLPAEGVWTHPHAPQESRRGDRSAGRVHCRDVRRRADLAGLEPRRRLDLRLVAARTRGDRDPAGVRARRDRGLGLLPADGRLRDRHRDRAADGADRRRGGRGNRVLPAAIAVQVRRILHTTVDGARDRGAPRDPDAGRADREPDRGQSGARRAPARSSAVAARQIAVGYARTSAATASP